MYHGAYISDSDIITLSRKQVKSGPKGENMGEITLSDL
jgi:hypothetical protein